MATDLVELNLENPQPEIIDRAVREVARGKIVGVPTDALYVLVADPLNLHAVGRVFAAKGRETGRSFASGDFRRLDGRGFVERTQQPLLHSGAPFLAWAVDNDCAGIGKSAAQGDGQYRVGWRSAIRNRRHLNMMVDKIGHALIATSANKSGKPTIKSGIELFAEMDGHIDLVLEGGLCNGQGSTTVDITEPIWKVIREGAITEKEIAERLQAS